MAVGIRRYMKYILYSSITLMIISFLQYDLFECPETNQTQLIINHNKRNVNTVLNRLQTRAKYLHQMCSKYNITNNAFLDNMLHRILYNPSYNLMNCFVPKSGYTTWLSLYEEMLKANGSFNYDPRIVANTILSTYELKLKLQGIHPTIKIMTCRDPLQRMVSGYKDKYHAGHNVDDTSARWFSYAYTCLELGEVQPNSTLSFEQYVIFILSCGSTNVHFASIHSFCFPCTIQYDYIIHLETFDDDVSALFKEVGVKGVNINVRKNSFPTNTAYLDYFRTLPPNLLLKIYEIIKLDMVLFGYQLPDFYKEFLIKNNVKILE